MLYNKRYNHSQDEISYRHPFTGESCPSCARLIGKAYPLPVCVLSESFCRGVKSKAVLASSLIW